MWRMERMFVSEGLSGVKNKGRSGNLGGLMFSTRGFSDQIEIGRSELSTRQQYIVLSVDLGII